jgi:hypothetical protein
MTDETSVDVTARVNESARPLRLDSRVTLLDALDRRVRRRVATKAWRPTDGHGSSPPTAAVSSGS